MQNPETHTCHTCGFTWKHGRSGSHNCRDLMQVTIEQNQERIKQLEDELSSMTHAAKELHGAISEYSLMPCRSLETRMMGTANRYAKRIFGDTK